MTIATRLFGLFVTAILVVGKQQVNLGKATLNASCAKYDLANTWTQAMDDGCFGQGVNLEKAKEVLAGLPQTAEALMNKATEISNELLSGGRSKIELELKANFTQWLQEQGFEAPKGLLESDIGTRYLNLAQDDHETALHWMEQSLTWQGDEIEDYIQPLQNGGLYAAGRCKDQLPIIVGRFRDLIDSDAHPDDFTKLSDILLSHVMLHGLDPEQGVEQFHLILDVKSVNVWEVPIKSIMSFMKHVGQHYPHRIHKVYLVNLSWVAKQALKVIHSQLSNWEKKQLKYYGSDYEEDFDDVIGLHNLEERYGGSLPNLQEGQYWPPRLI